MATVSRNPVGVPLDEARVDGEGLSPWPSESCGVIHGRHVSLLIYVDVLRAGKTTLLN